MTADLQRAKRMLDEGGFTCVLCRASDIYTSTDRGVKPLVRLIDSGCDLLGFCAADKVVGKATAFLYVLMGVKSVYANVISKPALAVLTQHEISTDYGCLVQNISNRRGDGVCPFENAVEGESDANAAYTTVLNKMAEMNISIY